MKHTSVMNGAVEGEPSKRPRLDGTVADFGFDAQVGSRLEQFISINSLDERCAATLRGLPEVESNWVMDQEFIIAVDPTRGSASAKVIGLVKKAREATAAAAVVNSMLPSGEVHQLLEHYIALNRLDERCVATLRSLPEAHIKWVMDQEFHLSVDPSKGSASAKVVGLIKKARLLDYDASVATAAAASMEQQIWEHQWLAAAPTTQMAADSLALASITEQQQQQQLLDTLQAANSLQAGLSRLDQFILLNGLDERCVSTLRGLSDAQANWVMDQEFILSVDPTRGSASAKVVGFIKKARLMNFNGLLPDPVPAVVAPAPAPLVALQPATDVRGMLEQYISINQLDGRCASTLRALSDAQAQWVMEQEFIVSVDPTRGSASAKVVGLIKRSRMLHYDPSTMPDASQVVMDAMAAEAQATATTHQPTVIHQSSRLEEYIAVNGLDERCAATLRSLPHAQANWVMNQEFILKVDPTKGSASAKVVGFMKKARTLYFEGSTPEAAPPMVIEPPQAPEPQPLGLLEQYIAINGLDERCAFTLRSLPEAMSNWVMEQEFVVSVDPSRGSASAKVVGIIKRAARAMGFDGVTLPQQMHIPHVVEPPAMMPTAMPMPRFNHDPHSPAFAAILEQYVALNGLDERCAATLRQLSEAQARWVVEQEFVVNADPGRGTASAKVVGLIKRARNMYFDNFATEATSSLPVMQSQPVPMVANTPLVPDTANRLEQFIGNLVTLLRNN